MESNKNTQYEMVELNRLIPYSNNARTHTSDQIDRVASSIREFGFLNPVIVSKDYTILCGHCRYYAAKKLNLEKVPCIKEEYLTEAQKKAYILADNRLALDAGWDEKLLKIELEELEGLDFDLGLTGFDSKELTNLFDIDTEGKEDDFDVEAELEKPCFSKTGDIWHLGKHTVICGDSTLPETYQRLLGDVKVNLVCTDPPYLVKLESKSGTIANDDLNDKDGLEFLKKAFSCFHDSMARDASIYTFYATSKARIFLIAF